ncbi:MAG: penicillin acylase family protein [Solirubrobacteraceae bacterium]
MKLRISAATMAAFGALAVAAPATAQVQPYGTNDYGGFRNILPPGTNGLDNAQQLVAWEAGKARPPHSSDQLAMYSNLTTAAPNIQPSQIGQYFKDATFGVKAGAVGSSESPEPGVTIVRDSQFGVPHIYGDTRPELMFGIGYATAEDRLFFIDVLRHAGNGDLASFAGGSNVGMDESVWNSEPYTQQDRQAQIDYIASQPGGAQVVADATSYIAGINAYISQAGNPLMLLTKQPAEYTALGIQPQPFQPTDLVSIATLVGGIFGGGGGRQLQNALLYQDLLKRFGGERYQVAGSPQFVRQPPARARPFADRSAFGTLLSFVDPSDPEAPTTVRGKSFPYQTLPAPTRAGVAKIALPDPGSVQFAGHVVAGAAPSGTVLGGLRRPHQLLAFPGSMSNALLISARDSAGGHPAVVMGPQVSYFAPEILMEEDIHGPGIDAIGAAFPGVNLYVELGHGRDYAWSATSSGQNIIDTFAVPLCNPAGGAVSTSSDHYLLHGQCVAMENLTDHESWAPNAADTTTAGSITLQSQRTAYGIVIARATIKGRPFAYTNLRSTYMHELDSALGFAAFNDPAQMRNPQQFMTAANKIGYTFNWFYADDKHIAYFNSGLNPVRAPGTNPLFPTYSSNAWPGLTGAPLMTPASLVERDTPQSAHPQTVDQSFLTSWNNKQAPGYNDAATGQQFSSIFRSQLLDLNIQHYLDGGRHKLTLTDVINAMGNAGTQDLRGVEVLPWALRVIGTPGDPALATAVSELRTWVASGAHRINREIGTHPPSGNYEQSDAVRIMDAWWPLLIKAQFTPVLGTQLLGQVEGNFSINDQPGHGTSGPHLGSSWDVGFYGIVQKDLRAVLGQRVRGPLNRLYCGGGSLAACRAALETSLSQAIAESPAQVYPADKVCKAGDQMCSDSIQFRPIGAVTQPLIEWVNRPTFQQADQILNHGPR